MTHNLIVPLAQSSELIVSELQVRDIILALWASYGNVCQILVHIWGPPKSKSSPGMYVCMYVCMYQSINHSLPTPTILALQIPLLSTSWISLPRFNGFTVSSVVTHKMGARRANSPELSFTSCLPRNPFSPVAGFWGSKWPCLLACCFWTDTNAFISWFTFAISGIWSLLEKNQTKERGSPEERILNLYKPRKENPCTYYIRNAGMEKSHKKYNANKTPRTQAMGVFLLKHNNNNTHPFEFMGFIRYLWCPDCYVLLCRQFAWTGFDY